MSTDAGSRRHVRDWDVRIRIYETDGETDAEAILETEVTPHLSSRGHSHRSSTDPEVPEIGDEVAVARALRRLADQLLDTAEQDIEQVTGEGDVTIRPR